MELALKDLDRLLRGEATRPSALRRGAIEISESGLPLLICLLGIFYGLCMGCFALSSKHIQDGILQSIATMAKVPALFLTTFLVTFPSLYVFNALVGSRLTLQSLWRLLLATLAVMLAVLASLGPIVAFFAFSTTSYPFMLLLNVGIFSLAGFLGLKFLLHTLHRLTVVLYDDAPGIQTAIAPEDETLAGAMEGVNPRAMGASVRQVFCFWVFAFCLVGMQMSWVLRPFISGPGKPFVLFSPRESNFYIAVFHAAQAFLGMG